MTSDASFNRQVWEFLAQDDLTEDQIRQFWNSGNSDDDSPQESQEYTFSTTLHGNTSTQISLFERRRQEIQRVMERFVQQGHRGPLRVHPETGRLLTLEDVHRLRDPPRADLPPVAPPQQPDLEDNHLNNNDPFFLEEDEAIEQQIRHEEEQVMQVLRRFQREWQQEKDSNCRIYNIAIPHPARQKRGWLHRHRAWIRPLALLVLILSTLVGMFLLQSSTIARWIQKWRPVMTIQGRNLVLLDSLVVRRTFWQHWKDCPGLHRKPPVSWWNGTNCADKVLHIPTSRQIIHDIQQKASLKSSLVDDLRIPDDMEVTGLNMSWEIPCISTTKHVPKDDTCIETSPNAHRHKCFRGIHDGFSTEKELRKALKLGIDLIQQGHTHDQYHATKAEIKLLQAQMGGLVSRLHHLLVNHYHVESSMKPIAFRVLAAGPLDGRGVTLPSRAGFFDKKMIALNETYYMRQVDRAKAINELSLYSLPWPLNFGGVRDVCRFQADEDLHERLQAHTSVFLSEYGYDEDYIGGEMLYMDHHPSNKNPRHRMRRGLMIDGAKHRVVVSSGGPENQWCRLPMRLGLQQVLEIWWGD